MPNVNRLRTDRATPGATIRDDHGGWLSFQHYDNLNRHHLGRSLPMLATEGGYWVGDDGDARYPATTPNLHMAQTLEAARMLMGTSTRYPAAPDYLFCVAFSVLANQQLGGTGTRGGNALPGTANAGKEAHCRLCAHCMPSQRSCANGRATVSITSSACAAQC